MASVDADQIVVGGTGAIYTAPVGTPLPATANANLNSLFLGLGYTTEDGVQFTDEKSVNEIRAWQSFYPVRRIVGQRNAMASFTLLEWDRKTVGLAFGGATVSALGGGEYKVEPPDPEELDERSMIIDIEDGAVKYRIVIPAGMVTSNTQSSFVRTGPSLLPVTFSVLGTDGAKPWTMFTDSAAMDAIEAGS